MHEALDSTIYMLKRRAATDDGDAPKKKITLDDMVVMHHGDPRIRHGVADGTTRHELLDAPKKMPPMQSTPHASDAAGWCSDPSLKLSPAMLVDLDLNGGVQSLLEPGGVGQCNFPDVPGMSDRWVFQVNPEEAGRVYFVEDAQRYEAKYGHAKYGKKLELMAKDIERGRGDAACSTLGADKWTVVLLLGRHQPVCRSGCLPAMAKAGIVVQRRAE